MKSITLNNGLKLLLCPQKEARSTTVKVLVRAGSRYESVEQNGASHFIEHILFKGTQRRPATIDISQELDSIGAEYNAYTAKDFTGYYIKVSADKAELALDVLSDMLFFSKFDEQEINRERSVIIEELKMYDDNPMMFSEEFFESLYFKGNSLARNIIGTQKIIKRISQRELFDCYKQFYHPENMVLSIAGKVDENTEKLARKYFLEQVSASGKTPKFETFTQRRSGPRVKIKYQDIQQVQFCLGSRSFSYDEKEHYAAYLLSVILGGNMSSRLFTSLRERKGLAYFVNAYNNFYEDTGCFIVRAGLDKANLESALEIILEELRNLSQDSISEKELDNAKEFLKGTMVLKMEDSSFLAEWYGKQEMLMRETLDPEKRFEFFQKVSVSQVNEVAREIFREKYLNLSLIGPFKKEEKFEHLLKTFE